MCIMGTWEQCAHTYMYLATYIVADIHVGIVGIKLKTIKSIISFDTHVRWFKKHHCHVYSTSTFELPHKS